MSPKSFGLKVSAFCLVFVLSFSQMTAAARPLFEFPFQQDDAKIKKLPRVNYVRSRTIHVKNVSIDLRFD